MKIIYVTLGLFFMFLGGIGVILPVLPTTPFLLLALACFTKGSKQFEKWFAKTKLYKNHLESFVNDRSMTLKNKITLLSFASTMLIIAFVMVRNLYVHIFIVFIFIYKYYYFTFKIETKSNFNPEFYTNKR